MRDWKVNDFWHVTRNDSRLILNLDEIDSIHYQYLSSNPRFNAPIYLIGDVLGGIAAYDFLLNENRIDRKASTISTPVLNHKSFKQTIVRRSFESTA